VAGHPPVPGGSEGGPSGASSPARPGAGDAVAGDGRQPPRLILGSASPRRRELLARLGIFADAICPAEIDEAPRAGELPRTYAERMAREKAMAIDTAPGDFVLSADTVVALGRRILGKPADAVEAAGFLRLLSGRRHRVTTAIFLRMNGRLTWRTVETRVKFKRLSEAEIAAYVNSGEWRGKAGGYAIQGIAAAFIPTIIGSYTNVVGLPLTETVNLLQGAGYDLTLGAGDA